MRNPGNRSSPSASSSPTRTIGPVAHPRACPRARGRRQPSPRAPRGIRLVRHARCRARAAPRAAVLAAAASLAAPRPAAALRAGRPGGGGERSAGTLPTGDPRKRFELADRLARVLDRCVVYRPDWVREWERGDAPHWLARLWRRAVEAEGSPSHWVGAIDAFRSALENAPRPPDRPSRASFFAVPSLSPSYLDLLNGIGRGIEINLFMVNPCREYWGDIYSRREMGPPGGGEPIRRSATSPKATSFSPRGGRAGRDQLRLARRDRERRRARALRAPDRVPAGWPPSSGTCSISVSPPKGGRRMKRETGAGPDARDDSIQGPRLPFAGARGPRSCTTGSLASSDRHPDLGPGRRARAHPEPRCLRAGRGGGVRVGRTHPVSTSPGRRSAASPAVRAFFELLAMRRSRLGAEAVLAPLEAQAVRARFGIGEGGACGPARLGARSRHPGGGAGRAAPGGGGPPRDRRPRLAAGAPPTPPRIRRARSERARGGAGAVSAPGGAGSSRGRTRRPCSGASSPTARRSFGLRGPPRGRTTSARMGRGAARGARPLLRRETAPPRAVPPRGSGAAVEGLAAETVEEVRSLIRDVER